MTLNWGRIRQMVLGISPTETSFAKRGFHLGDARVRHGLEQIGLAFVTGYQAALYEEQVDAIALELNQVEVAYRGFAYEGAAMSLTLLDCLAPWRNRVSAFLSGPGAQYTYLAHVGVGWGLARVPGGRQRILSQLDPLIRWLAIDGYGFHQGYFHWPRYVTQQTPPTKFPGYAARAFDQGLGRSLWFVQCADATRIASSITSFPASRQGDLWSGVGLACAYAGGVERDRIEALAEAAGTYRAHLAQGAAFAAEARRHAGNPAVHTDLACQVLGGISAVDAAKLTVEAQQQLPSDGDVPAYEIWRRRIREKMTLRKSLYEQNKNTVSPPRGAIGGADADTHVLSNVPPTHAVRR